MNDKELMELVNHTKLKTTKMINLVAHDYEPFEDVLKCDELLRLNQHCVTDTKFYRDVHRLATSRAKQLFDAAFVDISPISGEQANQIIYQNLLHSGDKVIMFNSSLDTLEPNETLYSDYLKNCQVYECNVAKKTQLIQYDQLEKMALEIRPALIVIKTQAYSRIIDFKRCRAICDAVGAKLLVDISSVVGLVATGHYPNPVIYADVVTGITHQTLRGPVGGLVMTNNEAFETLIETKRENLIQREMWISHVISKAVAFKAAMNSDFNLYQKNILKNTKQLEKEFKSLGVKLLTKGTDYHSIIIDTDQTFNLTNEEAEKILHQSLIKCKKVIIKTNDQTSNLISGLEIGPTLLTLQQFTPEDMSKIAQFIKLSLTYYQDEAMFYSIKKQVAAFLETK